MYKLEKMSTPGWEFRSEYIEHIYRQLNDFVCGLCKQTEAEYRKATLEVDAEYNDDFDHFKPDNFSEFSYEEKIDWLLGTACGCEFDFYNEADGSGLIFKEI